MNFNHYLNNEELIYTAASILTLDRITFLWASNLRLHLKIPSSNIIYVYVYLYIREVCSYSIHFYNYSPKTEHSEWYYLIDNDLENETKKVRLI
jgi:hypothetical protein